MADKRLFVPQSQHPALAALAVGEKGILRVPIEPSPIEPLSHWYQHPEEGWWTCGNNVGQTWRCPLQPGRVWVPTPWRFHGFTEEGEPWIEYPGIAPRIVLPSEEWTEGRLTDIWAKLSDPANFDIDGRAADRVWRSPATMPAWAARLRLELLEEGRPAKWCEGCGTRGKIFDYCPEESEYGDEGCVGCDIDHLGKGECNAVMLDCPACDGSPPWWWEAKTVRLEAAP